MKLKENFVVELKKSYFKKVVLKKDKFESNYLTKPLTLSHNEVDYDLKEDSLYLSLHIKSIVYFQSIYQDDSVVKKVLKNGYTTAKPETTSKIYFDYEILVNGNSIFSTFKSRNDVLTENQENKFYDEQKYHFKYIKEYDISDALDEIIGSMKKFEESEVVFKTIESIKYGEDFEKLVGYFKKSEMEFTNDFI